ncbi:MAG: DUF6036 family nucleotidyltransferase [Thermodesulfovibrionales bacterium]
MFKLKLKEPIEIIIVGGLAMQAYGLSLRKTVDLDGEIKASDESYLKVIRELTKKSVVCNISDNLDRWGVIPMPDGYRERSTVYHQKTNLTVKILDPVDFVISMLRRGTEEDLQDAEEVVKHFNIRKSDIASRLEIISLPKDTESLLFKKLF